MDKPLINVAEATTQQFGQGKHFGCSMAEVAWDLGAQAIGANLTRVPPGKASCPYHHHHANEEHFFVVGGTGVLRFGDEKYQLTVHDYVVCLPGGPDRAHQFINTGSEDLVFLAVSTRVLPEVVGYPDSGKTGVRTASGDDDASRFLVPRSAIRPMDYWHGETGDEVAAIVSGK